MLASTVKIIPNKHFKVACSHRKLPLKGLGPRRCHVAKSRRVSGEECVANGIILRTKSTPKGGCFFVLAREFRMPSGGGCE